MTDYKVIIVGGGASGLLNLVELVSGNNALKPSEVLLLEANDRVGKKLVATGNGQGNFSNAFVSENRYHGDEAFISTYVKLFNQVNLDEYFLRLGIPFCEGEDGKKYPLSKQANSALDVIRMFLESKGCNIKTGEKVIDAKVNGKNFVVKTQNQTYISSKLVLAFGGKAGKQFGTDGTSYHLAQNFSHFLTEQYPSLVQLKTPLDRIKGLKGLKENVIISAFDGDKFLSRAKGELLFTEYGISGSAVFSVSSYLTDKKSPNVKIEFLPGFSEDDVAKLLKERQKLAYINGQDLLIGLINKKIGQALCKNLTNPTAENLAKLVKNFRIKITGNLGFNYAQVTKGGVKTNEINPNSMESKLQKGLYILGEALDIDGDCGGFNLAFAFTSGIISAKHIKDNF